MKEWRRFTENGIKEYLKSEKNKDRRIEYHKFIVRWYKQLKKNKKCIKCFENNPVCLSFHHRNPDDKTMGIYQMVKEDYPLEIIKREVKKCDILCLNCHAKLHYSDNQENLTWEE